MRKKIVAGNWKMNLDLNQGEKLLKELLEKKINQEVTTVIAPPYIHLNSFRELISNSTIKLAAQNCHQQENGAYTGEISIGMLKSVGVEYVIVGHSERREYFLEDSLALSFKVTNLINQGMNPIYCCGETLSQRKDGDHFSVIKKQIEQGLFQLNEMELSQCIIAYEPVWAIGTGETATPEQAQEIHHHIRKTIANQYGEIIANLIPILYGGSVKPNNAKELFSCSDIDGGLIGGAALNASSFADIINSF
mgnify:FL=1